MFDLRDLLGSSHGMTLDVVAFTRRPTGAAARRATRERLVFGIPRQWPSRADPTRARPSALATARGLASGAYNRLQSKSRQRALPSEAGFASQGAGLPTQTEGGGKRPPVQVCSVGQRAPAELCESAAGLTSLFTGTSRNSL